MAVEDYLTVRSAIRSLADPKGRPVAKTLLVDYGVEAVPPLIRALEDSDGELVCGAAQVLGEIGDARAVAPLGGLAMHGTSQVATAAVAALGRIPDPASLDALDRALHSEHSTVRLEAALSLARLSGELSSQALETLGHLRPEDVSPLCQALLTRLGPGPRESAFRVALQIDAEAAVWAMLAGLEVRQTAPTALDLLRRPDAVRPLLDRLTPGTAAEIIPIVAFLGRGLRRDLSSARDSRVPLNYGVRVPLDYGVQVARALDDMAVVLVRLLTEVDPDCRPLVVEALQTLEHRATASLRRRLIEAVPDDRSTIAWALTQLNWEPTPDEAGARYWIALGDLSRCAHAGHDAIGPLLEEFWGDDLDRRDAAATVLRRLGWRPEDRGSRLLSLIALHQWQLLALMGETVVPTLIEAQSAERAAALTHLEGDHRTEVRIAIVQTLGQLAGSAAANTLVEALRTDPSQKVRGEAQLALERLGNDSVAALVQALRMELDLAARASPERRSARAGIRQHLVRTLARMRSLDALEVLLRTLNCDPAPATRAAASDAIQRLSLTAPKQVVELTLSGIGEGITPELGRTLQQLGEPAMEHLQALISSSDEASIRRAVAGYVALGQAGTDVVCLLSGLVLSASAQARLAVTQVWDRLGIEPGTPETWAAYWLAKGEIERCEALGSAAVAVLMEALPVYHWREAGPIALSLVRLGIRPSDPALEATMASLRRMSDLDDEIVTQMVDVDHEGRPDRQLVVLTVSHREERQAARKLLAAIDRAWAEQLGRIREHLE